MRIALFESGRLIALLSSQKAIHEFARERPGIYSQRTVSSFDELHSIIQEEIERYDTVQAIMRAGESAAYQFLYADK
jgi:hypothetical protein